MRLLKIVGIILFGVVTTISVIPIVLPEERNSKMEKQQHGINRHEKLGKETTAILTERYGKEVEAYNDLDKIAAFQVILILELRRTREALIGARNN